MDELNRFSLARMALEILLINEEFTFRSSGKSEDSYNMYTFIQTWGSTAGGFDDIGGCALTDVRTYVFVHKCTDECLVFFGGRFAYKCKFCDSFKKDLNNQWMVSVHDSVKYDKLEGNN